MDQMERQLLSQLIGKADIEDLKYAQRVSKARWADLAQDDVDACRAQFKRGQLVEFDYGKPLTWVVKARITGFNTKSVSLVEVDPNTGIDKRTRWTVAPAFLRPTTITVKGRSLL